MMRPEQTPSIAELASMVRQGDVSATSLTEAALEAAEKNASLNAFIYLDGDRAIASARGIDARIAQGEAVGPLAGVPIAIKDNMNWAGARTTAGTPAIDYVAPSSAPVVERLEEAGAIIIGKTNMHELAFGVTSNNAAFGVVRNAADPSRFPGGSSGGTATAIAAGIVPAGLGSDTAGSVRLPAALCGIVGFRPTTWRIDPKGVVPSVPTFDVVGPMAGTVADTALLDAVLTGGSVPARRDIEGLRFGVPTPYVQNLSPGVATAFDAARAQLTSAGVDLVEIDLSAIAGASFEVGFTVGFFEMRTRLTDFLAKFQPGTSLEDVVERIASPDVKAVYVGSVLGDGAPTQDAYDTAIARIEQIRANYLAILDAHQLDAVIFPTAALEAQMIDGGCESVTLNGETMPTIQVYMRNVASTGVYGAPGLSLPLKPVDGGLPVGLEIDGRPDGDLAILSIGLGVEAALERP
ncbi:MAG: amidase family protein [Pseudomonadota bacterium]